jgi:hypothetical protein
MRRSTVLSLPLQLEFHDCNAGIKIGFHGHYPHAHSFAHDAMYFFQNLKAYLVTAVSYAHQMFMKSTK